MEQGKMTSWRQLFSPGSVAIIGASSSPGSWGYNITKGLLATRGRRIYPVNPKADEILGAEVYRSVTDIPDPVDLAVIAVAAPLVPHVLRECISKAVKAAVVISSGFAETGEPGREAEADLVKIARQGGLRFIGPNTMGHADTRSHLSTFGQSWEAPAGPMALLAQSGGMCLKLVRYFMDSGIALSKYISTGNEADLRLEDYLEYLAEDDDTAIIAAYIEGLREGRRFLRLAGEITARKPIVIIKTGGTKEAARAVTSHTGVLAGSDEVYTAAFKQAGVIRVEDEDELSDVAFALLNCPLPRSNRVGILSIGGGQAVLTAEACEKEGLVMSPLAPSTVRKLDKHLPSRWSRRNPIDMAGPSTADFMAIADLLWVLMEDSNTDAVLLLAPILLERSVLARHMGLSPEQIKAQREKDEKNLKLLREKIEEYGKPVVVMWQPRRADTEPEISALFRKERIPTFSNSRRAARVMQHLVWYRQYLDAAGKSSRP